MSQLPAKTSGGLIPQNNTSVCYERDGHSRERYQKYDYKKI